MRTVARDRTSAEELMKPDLLCTILLLSGGIVIAAVVTMVVVLALTHGVAAYSSTTPAPPNYSLLPISSRFAFFV